MIPGLTGNMLFWAAATAGTAGTLQSIQQSKRSMEYRNTELENRKLMERNSAIEQSTLRLDQMARAMSSQAVTAAAGSSLGSSVFRNSIQQESVTAGQDIGTIERNTALSENALTAQQSVNKAGYQTDKLNKLFNSSKTLLGSFSLYNNPQSKFDTKPGYTLPTPF